MIAARMPRPEHSNKAWGMAGAGISSTARSTGSGTSARRWWTGCPIKLPPLILTKWMPRYRSAPGCATVRIPVCSSSEAPTTAHRGEERRQAGKSTGNHSSRYGRWHKVFRSISLHTAILSKFAEIRYTPWMRLSHAVGSHPEIYDRVGGATMIFP
jgi:hypothetical protein